MPATYTDPHQPPSWADQPVAERDRAVAELAARRHGVVTTAELAARGLNRQAVQVRTRSGRLHRVHRGVFAVGHRALSEHGRFFAAVAACGEGAALSHRSAAKLWGMLDRRPPFVEVVVEPGRHPRHRGVRVRERAGLGSSSVRSVEGIAVTAPAPTLIDLAGVIGPRGLRAAVRGGFGHRLLTVSELTEAMAMASGRRGIRALRRIVADGIDSRSELEDAVAAVIRAGAFVEPERNRPIVVAGRRFLPDFHWVSAGVILEADGRAWHDHPVARRADRERQELLESHGQSVVRVTWRQAVGDPTALIRRLTAAGVPTTPNRTLSTSAPR